MRAPEYFKESINSECPWNAYQCDDEEKFNDGKCLSCDSGCVTMGYHTTRPKESMTGKYYLLTNDKAPFCGKISFNPF